MKASADLAECAVRSAAPLFLIAEANGLQEPNRRRPSCDRGVSIASANASRPYLTCEPTLPNWSLAATLAGRASSRDRRY